MMDKNHKHRMGRLLHYQSSIINYFSRLTHSQITKRGDVAPKVERRFEEPRGVGSTPTVPTFLKQRARGKRQRARGNCLLKSGGYGKQLCSPVAVRGRLCLLPFAPLQNCAVAVTVARRSHKPEIWVRFPSAQQQLPGRSTAGSLNTDQEIEVRILSG